jgi:F420-0:gamma-glutamyl ligase
LIAVVTDGIVAYAVVVGTAKGDAFPVVVTDGIAYDVVVG